MSSRQQLTFPFGEVVKNHFETSLNQTENLFVKLPYRNYFQYPPLGAITAGAILPNVLDLAVGEMADSNPFTIFFSIPFCRVHCNSCPYFIAYLPKKRFNIDPISEYISLLELQLRSYSAHPRFYRRVCRAIYFGGGTASLLPPESIRRLINLSMSHFQLAVKHEITLEGNPREFSREYLDSAREAGITRISIGFQSNSDSILKTILNSPHTATQGLSSINSALAAGFETVNVDLLYRIPGQTFEQWQFDLRLILNLRPESITTYDYVVHSNSVAERLILSGKIGLQVSDTSIMDWARWTRLQMLQHGYEESSSGTFTLPGHEQAYSLYTYGKGCDLVGLGAKAYSYINGYQFAAPGDISMYGHSVKQGMFPVIERISKKASNSNLMERFVIFNLRRASMVSKIGFIERFGVPLRDVFPEEIALLERSGTLTESECAMELTELGRQWRYNVLESFYNPCFLET